MRKIIGNPGIDGEHLWMHVQGIVVSNINNPLFTIEKYCQNKIKILTHVNFRALGTYNYFKNVKKLAPTTLEIDKEFEIESAEAMSTSSGKK
jgi:hypothetical protein